MTDATTTIDTALASIKASPKALQVLQDLHQQALAEPAFVSTAQPITSAIDKFVALDPDKCALVYLLLRSSGARFVVEAGTSFGVSTIYLALAVGQNAAAASGAAAALGDSSSSGKVIATENEPTKSAKALTHWRTIGDEVEPWIDLREGDLRETLQSDLPAQIDFVLLDIWTPLALPALSRVHRNLRVGAMVVVDNFVLAAKGYTELQAFLDDPANGFKVTTAPYEGGLLIAVYLGH